MPLRPRGLLLAALAAAALALGILRADLAGLFWGSSFLLAAAYAAVGSLLLRIALKRRAAAGPSFLSIRLPAGGLAPGTDGEARVTASLPRALLPGFTVRLVVRPTWHDRVLGPISVELAPGSSDLALPFRAARRGAYTATHAELEIADALGLARRVLRLPVEESARVLPAAAPRRGPLREPGEGGDAPRYERRRQRSEELLEVREYVPGDDVRRLNWKLFAHAGELFLRVGEENPPPRSRLLVVLDTSRPAPAGRDDELLDLLVEDCASSAASFLGRGVELLVTRPGAVRLESFAPGSRRDLLAWLADAWWTVPGDRLELPVQRSLRALVHSVPGSPGLERILSELRSRRWKTVLALSELPAPPRRRRPGLRELLLAPARAGSGGS